MEKNTIQLTKEAWLKPLQKVVNISDKKQIMPILAFVLLQKEGEQLHFIGTDTDLEVRTKITLPADQASLPDFTLTLPGKTLLDICNNLTDGSCLSLTEAKTTVILNSSDARFELATLPAENFPLIDLAQIKIQHTFTIAALELKNIVQKTIFAVANQNVRQYLNGLMLTLETQTLSTVATDSHRMAFIRSPIVADFDEPKTLILPKKTAGEIQRLITEDRSITVKINENFVQLCTDDFLLTSKLIGGRCPMYQKIVPPNGPIKIILNTLAFTQAVAKVNILVNDLLRAIRLTVKENELILESNSGTQAAKDRLKIEYSGTPIELLLNIEYLKEALRQISTEQCCCFLTGEKQAVILEENAPTTYATPRYVIMPFI